jgi:alginate O-acetyltransferase complex protein AlgI
VVFTTTVFVFYFLPIVLAVYFALPRRARNAFLILASYVFYGWYSPRFVLLMLATTVVDYGCGKLISQPGASARQRRAGLVVSVVSNLGLLAFFKYSGLAVDSANTVLAIVGRQPFSFHAIALPVGISFYTFNSMSYAVDLYRGEAKPARSLIDFMAFVSLFPHLVAGPILRYQLLADQLRDRRETEEGITRGFAYFILGFAKKILLANPMSEIADAAFAAGSPPWHLAWFGAMAFAFQIYFDFSGYTDMAIGLGRILGFEFPQNFNAPFLSESVTDFWRRWHLSLSNFLRDYLYRPLGGNQKGPTRTHVNLIVTMTLGGLWHGAQWKFVLWGALHGLMLALERRTKDRCLWGSFSRPGRIVFTFFALQVHWVLFRAETVTAAARYVGSMFSLRATDPGAALLSARMCDRFHLLVFGVCAVLSFIPTRTQDLVETDGREVYRRALPAALLLFVFAVSIVEMWSQSLNPFLYFQF